MKNNIKILYGLPKKVIFCKKTLISNQKPTSAVEFHHNLKSKKRTLFIDKNQISDSWKYSRIKKKINYKKREKELLKLLDRHRSNNRNYDCIVPGSGGKDSCYATHVLKYKYGMNPLTITWPPILYTKYGKENFNNWLSTCKVDNVTARRDESTMKLLTKLSVENLMHPFQTFILGQKIFAAKIALKYKIPLVFFGENEAEHGNPIADNNSSLRDKSYYSSENIYKLYLGGVKIEKLINNYKLKKKNLEVFLPPSNKDLNNQKIEVHYLGYYLKWVPQETFYYSVENCGFRPRPFRTQGTYSKYNSIDDKIDDLHYYTTYIKFGIGRATYDVSQELRNDHLNIDEGKKLIKKYDGEFPNIYFNEVMEYLNIKPKNFFRNLDKFRSPHLWKKINGEWRLRHTVNRDGTDD
ncbi:N-acetyl sugar amidotransferase [Candidatus Pelagibacter sp.]|nr:N-acetyl sugar amidotransferase [Candidatus Pelagibacter sp.]